MHWNPGLHRLSHSSVVLPLYLLANMGPPVPPVATRPSPPAAALPQVLSAQLPISTPPTSLDECFFSNSLVVGLPHSLIFWQFWLFFVFKFVVVLLLVVRGGKVYLPMPPSWPEVSKNDHFYVSESLGKNTLPFFFLYSTG